VTLVAGRNRVVARVLVVGVAALWWVVAASAQQTVDLTGRWRMAIEMEVGRATPLLELTQKASTLSGTYTGRYGASPVEGTLEGRRVSFTVALETTSLAFQGEVKEDGTLAGTATFGELGDVKWTAKRETAK
jgi:hypothetical protein